MSTLVSNQPENPFCFDSWQSMNFYAEGKSCLSSHWMEYDEGCNGANLYHEGNFFSASSSVFALWFLLCSLYGFYVSDHKMSGALCHGLCVGVHKHLVSVNYRTNAWVDFSVAFWG
jgi:hypothetical protein